MSFKQPFIYGLLFLFSFQLMAKQPASDLTGKVIVVDPGHGGTAAKDSYRVGPSGEREEWINLRVALLLEDLLKEKGATVLMTRTEDVEVSLSDRARLAVENDADLFISIHHNATADPSVSFPIIYYHGVASQNQAGPVFAQLLASRLVSHMYSIEAPQSVVSDFTIFAGRGASVLRGSYGIPGVIAEASFFTNPKEEKRLRKRKHNMAEAQAYAEAIEAFFSQPIPEILPKDTSQFPPKFQTLQEAERMSPEALKWRDDFDEALALMLKNDATSITKAYELFTRSARSFPDSYLARECHQNRVILLKRMGKTEEAEQEMRRVREYYVK